MNNVNEVHEALARVVVADRELSEVLTEILRIARLAMPSVEAASVTLIREDWSGWTGPSSRPQAVWPRCW